MKFAKELEQEAVPEWRVKYLNYKAGKKHIKAVARAIHRANGTPTQRGRTAEPPQRGTSTDFFSLARTFTATSDIIASTPIGTTEHHSVFGKSSPGPIGYTGWTSARTPEGAATGGERSGLAKSPGSGMKYGSFALPASRASARTDFELPAPAMRVPSGTSRPSPVLPPSPELRRITPHRSATTGGAVPSASTLDLPLGAPASPRHRMARIFSSGSPLARQASSKHDIGMQNLDYVRMAERDFFSFLGGELDKIEVFYRQKEDQASERLIALREQLHEMRNRRTAEIAEAKKVKEAERNNSSSQDDTGEASKDSNGSHDWMNPIKAKFLRPGPNSKALQRMTQTPVMAGQDRGDDGRDYVRRPPSDDVPYRTAKRKLKLALQEFYRGLELLKSYALMNRTAFRKLNKKYDKAIHARPPYRYMNEKVNKSWFVNSDILDGHIRTVEDLYARYFERGNRKIAAGKLRNLTRRPGDESASSFRSGILIGIGAVFAVQGLIYASEMLFDEELDMTEDTSYLMQIYGGYFLILFLFALFTLACRVWTTNKVNYPFIFEFDPRNNLDWKQLAEFPSFFFALFGVFIWLNFSKLGNWQTMYLYYPVILIGLSLAILFFPAPILHHKARRWFLYSHYRLFFAGLYPVEFRDFFLGDIWCSLAYAACNVELFFCLYAHYWDNPDQCNSNHSRLMGFLGALPPIWRALQCIRRYHDTQNVFPHLVNCGKYSMSITAAVCLSLFRIDGSNTTLSLFITFSTINAVYSSIWDLFMDFSILQPHARHPLLRDIISIKPVWVYYAVMVLDPILRFSWIFYAIFTHNTQHSTIVSFLVAFAEVTRRGIWLVFRVENEHCGNVAQYKASRDTPLPYHLHLEEESTSSLEEAMAAATIAEDRASLVGSRAGTARTTGAEVAAAAAAAGTPGSGRVGVGLQTPSIAGGADRTPSIADEAAATTRPEMTSGGTFRRRAHTRTDTMGRKGILKVMAEAHMQDFEKRRPTEETKARAAHDEEDDDEAMEGLHSDDEEEDEDDSHSLREERMQAREAETLVKGGRHGESESD